MFIHQHPYVPFIPEQATKLIIGTLPPPRFSTGQLHDNDVDFCYGSRDGQLWPIIDQIFNLKLSFENTIAAIQERKKFLIAHNIGICDIVARCKRAKVDASDMGMQDVILRNIISYLKQYPKIRLLLFMGGNSKNGPEYFFRQHLNQYDISLKCISNNVPRMHEFSLGKQNITTVSLTSPSGAANRAVGSNPDYKTLKKDNPDFNTIDFRILQYTRFFKD